jgi:polysaccharide export outer membrane protein
LQDDRAGAVRIHILAAAMLSFAMGGCAADWDTTMPSAPPGGAGLMAGGVFAQGAEAVSAASAAKAGDRTGSLPPFGSSGEAASYEFQNGYRVGAGDRLAVKVLGQPDLDGEHIVDSTGRISLPLVNDLEVRGLSTSAIETTIAARLRDGYLRSPSVSVQLVAARPFFILGQVNQAGGFPYQTGMTVQNAIAIAGGYTPRADEGAVLVTRKSADGTRTFKVPVTTYVYPGDTIYIRERWF